MRPRSALLTSALIAAPLVFPLAARAQPVQGLYVAAGAGLNLPQAFRASLDVPALQSLTRLPALLGLPAVPSTSLRVDDRVGFDWTGSVGYALGNGFRFEAEGDYIRNGLHLDTPPGIVGPTDGHLSTFGVMANALFDFDIGSRYVFPYLGVGAGYMWTRVDNARIVIPGIATATGSGTGPGKFAWQVIAGAAFPVPNTPGLSLTAQYRLLDVTAGERVSDSVATLKLGPQYSHTFLLGVRYAFNVPPPGRPAPPAPIPVVAPGAQAARSYIVFFDWDKATLTDRAREIIRTAAEASRHTQFTQIRVNGYTDTSGTARVNQALSLSRAQRVAAELVRDGVPRNAIAIHGFGATHTLVQTGPGVREPQNRRVEIIIA